MSDTADSVIECIERAFLDVVLEDGISVREADVIDDYGTASERRNARAQDEQHDWTRIPDEVISHYHWCLSFFDAKGMKFQLPAYMRFAVRHCETSDSASIDSTIYALARDDERFTLFTASQRAAVRQFLKFMAFNAGRHVDSRSARHALESAWKE